MSFLVVVLAALVACTSAFAPVPSTRPAFKATTPLSMSPKEEAPISDKNVAAVAAFATAMAPFAAQAQEAGAIDEGVVIGYGAGLVACVVSLAVGFSIGYGTLVKP